MFNNMTEIVVALSFHKMAVGGLKWAKPFLLVDTTSIIRYNVFLFFLMFANTGRTLLPFMKEL